MYKVSERSGVYKLENSSETVATAKSAFADEYDLPYDKLSGAVICSLGNGLWDKHPKYCAVVYTGDE